MAKSKRSWTKDDNIPGLIASKKVDWSVFEYGSHIPVDFHEDFKEANSGYLPSRGESRLIKLIIDGTTYEANLVKYRDKRSDTLEIRYNSNANLKQLMMEKLATSYNYLKEERQKRQLNGDAKLTIVPDDVAEYIDFYKTEVPYQYRVEFRTRNTLQSRDVDESITADELTQVVNYITSRGYVYEPWQIAAYVVALRTKPFIILAGVSGTGKSKLPALVSEATGGEVQLVSVRPDWTDSTDILGYVNLQGNFMPGPLLEIAREALENKDKHYVCIIDEMNLARVEHYFAEVLSRIEDKKLCSDGRFNSGPLLVQKLEDQDAIWSSIGLPANLVLVGTVNMDESTHGFSRKVLDRAFTIELSEVDLTVWESTIKSNTEPVNWSVNAWYPRAIRLGTLENVSETEHHQIESIINELVEINKFLGLAHCQVGYRTRDEVVMFVLHARDVLSSFTARSGKQIDPLDLALQMKILPRIAGGSNTIRQTLLQLLGWTYKKQPFHNEEDVNEIIAQWQSDGQPQSLAGAQYPRTAARLCLMWDRMINEGFTSYWL